MTLKPARLILRLVTVGVFSWMCVGEAACAHKQVSPVLALIQADSEGEARSALSALGCSPPYRFGITRRSQTLTFTFLALVAIAAAVLFGPLLRKRNVAVDVGNLLIAAGLLVAAWQWQASIEQKALEQYTSEIATMNATESDDAGDEIHTMMSHLYRSLPGESKPSIKKIHYVYLELDNLEYALERYTQGLASAYTTARAVKTFDSRCASREFRVRTGQQLSPFYSPVVARVVKALGCNHQ